jgi:hypothetical protein
MLMITQSEGGGQTRTLKLEGKLFGPWLSELKSARAGARLSPGELCLDLLGLNFIDPEGARFLAELIRDGASVVGCSGFIAEMLRLEGL